VQYASLRFGHYIDNYYFEFDVCDKIDNNGRKYRLRKFSDDIGSIILFAIKSGHIHIIEFILGYYPQIKNEISRQIRIAINYDQKKIVKYYKDNVYYFENIRKFISDHMYDVDIKTKIKYFMYLNIENIKDLI